MNDKCSKCGRVRGISAPNTCRYCGHSGSQAKKPGPKPWSVSSASTSSSAAGPALYFSEAVFAVASGGAASNRSDAPTTSSASSALNKTSNVGESAPKNTGPTLRLSASTAYRLGSTGQDRQASSVVFGAIPNPAVGPQAATGPGDATAGPSVAGRTSSQSSASAADFRPAFSFAASPRTTHPSDSVIGNILSIGGAQQEAPKAPDTNQSVASFKFSMPAQTASAGSSSFSFGSLGQTPASSPQLFTFRLPIQASPAPAPPSSVFRFGTTADPSKADGSKSDLQAEAAAVKSKLDAVTHETKTLEDKLERSKALNHRLATLKASQDILSSANVVLLQRSCNEANLKITKSDIIKAEISEAERKIAQLKLSKDLLNDDERTRLVNERAMNESKLNRSKSIQSEILSIQINEGLLSKEATQQLEEKVNSVRKLIGSGQSGEKLDQTLQEKQSKVRRDLECTICLDIPKGEVYSCQQQHLLCKPCMQKWFNTCPVCRQDFRKTPPLRNRLAEKIIKNLE